MTKQQPSFLESIGDALNWLADDIKDAFSGKETELKKPESEEPKGGRVEYLIDYFMFGIKKNSISQTSIYEIVPELYKLNNRKLYKAHALGCIHLDKLDMAYSSLEKIARADDRSREMLGLVAHQKHDYKTAVKQFTGIDMKAKNASSVAFSLSLWHTGEREPQKHYKILKDIVEDSLPANIILGTVYFNKGLYREAEKYFAKAVKLQPNSMEQRFNVLRCQYKNVIEKCETNQSSRNNKDHTNDTIGAFYLINQFYIETGCKWLPKETEEKLRIIELDMPRLHISNNDLINVLDALVK
ncbi:tetratricopeptide repeat protein [Candidatus Woesearchaeota archaeon]|nr:tetratricopeptide repeat protein [Candidatus Woesearchaeota archaeon]